MSTELIGWNVDGWYAEEAAAAQMAAWYENMRDVNEVHLVTRDDGAHGVLYLGSPFALWHSGRDCGALSEDARRRMFYREDLLPAETDEGLQELLVARGRDDLAYHEVQREIRRRAAEPNDTLPKVSAPSGAAPLTEEPACVTCYNTEHTWSELLEGDGWELHHVDRNGEEHWVRPGKNRRAGSSATIGHGGLDLLYVFSSSIPWLPVRDRGRGYDRWGYMVHRDYAGDFREALRATGSPKPSEPVGILIERKQ